MPEWVQIIVKLTSAFVTLVVGVVASGIAYFQYRISRDKLRLDLCSKRLEAYEKLQECLGRVFCDGCVNDATYQLLWEARYKSRFLFGSEVEAQFEELVKKAGRMQTLRRKLAGPEALPIGPERIEASEEETKLLLWTGDQVQSSTEVYSRYLSFAHLVQ